MTISAPVHAFHDVQVRAESETLDVLFAVKLFVCSFTQYFLKLRKKVNVERAIAGGSFSFLKGLLSLFANHGFPFLTVLNRSSKWSLAPLFQLP